MYETLKQAHYEYVRKLEEGIHLLRDTLNDKLEVWYSNKNHASYGLIYKNTHLEFTRDYKGENHENNRRA